MSGIFLTGQRPILHRTTLRSHVDHRRRASHLHEGMACGRTARDERSDQSHKRTGAREGARNDEPIDIQALSASADTGSRQAAGAFASAGPQARRGANRTESVRTTKRLGAGVSPWLIDRQRCPTRLFGRFYRRINGVGQGEGRERPPRSCAARRRDARRVLLRSPAPQGVGA